MLKRLLDICLAVPLLIATFPLWLMATIGIRLSSPGPIFYAAKRVGKGGGIIRILKFRSMHVSNEEGSVITAPGDVRVFPFGRFIRASKIDELPQLFNVISGDLSFVGPRPEDPKIVDRYYTDHMRKTLDYLPGLTSAGTLYFMREFSNSVDANDSEESYANNILKDKLEMDLNHAQQANVWDDLVLIFKTGFFVFSQLVARLLGKSRHE